MLRLTVLASLILVSAPAAALAQSAPAPAAAVAQTTTTNPFPTPIESSAGVVSVKFTEFAVIPDAANGEAPRMMHLVNEPGSRRMFVATMRGQIYGVSYDGKTVTEYIDVNAPAWNIGVQSQGSERGLQSIVFHPEFNQRGARGYGKFYTYTDTPDITPAPDFTAAEGAKRTHDTVLLEWTANNPVAPTYDGAAPKELFRVAQPFANHNAGEVAFNLLAKPGTADYGLLYVGSADGGSGGDPMNLSQNLSSVFGKILRIDPLGTNSRNGKYGIPKINPFVGTANALGEIYALGVRNPQRFTWDSRDGRMFVADIGQNVVEEISPVTAGSNLGWNKWEGSYKYVNRQVDLTGPRTEAGMTWPVAEYDHTDPLVTRAAVTGVYVYRDGDIKQLRNLLIFGDNPSGEIFYVNADALSNSGQSQVRRIMFDDKGTNKTLLQLIREKNAAQGKPAAARADLRMGRGPNNQLFILNKRDGVIRLLVP
ncbi:MAG TPA: PQQ-dependent sugar dehydrogenase [Vicinamibacterales bacterium]|nr:PQQ-dependent sugar dehydrogenase [Vicinamibacterales bacterium]